MVEKVISEKDAGQRLNKYVMKYLNLAPSSFVYKMLRKKNITLNGKKAAGDEILSAGDCLKFFLSDETIDKFRSEKGTKTIAEEHMDFPLKILYQNEDILAVSKPAGVLSQKARREDVSINEMIVEYCLREGLISKEAFETFTPSVCNRLDRNTSGIILAGITLNGSQSLSEQLRERSCHKYYTTLVKGAFREALHETAYIQKNSEKNESVVVRGEKAKELETEYRKKNRSVYEDYNKIETAFSPIEIKHDFTLLRVTLYTGKSHQIRAHLKALGYPVLGDRKYGDEALNRSFQERFRLRHHLLHAGELVFPDGLVISDALPAYFQAIWDEI